MKRTVYTGPDIVGLTVHPDGSALRPGPIEDDPRKVQILSDFCRELYQ